MSISSSLLSTGHTDMIHDAQFDYYGKRLATASSDRTIKIFDIIGEKQILVSTIRGIHEGPIWGIGWAHPRFGNIIASCAYDGRVVIMKETAATAAAPSLSSSSPSSPPPSSSFIKIYENYRPDTSYNGLSFFSSPTLLQLSSGNSDGTISIFTKRDGNDSNSNTFDTVNFMAHKGGTNAVSFSPEIKSTSIQGNNAQSSPSSPVHLSRRLVSAGCDGMIRIWRYDPSSPSPSSHWQEDVKATEGILGCHSDWVRDVSWSPSASPFSPSFIASCGEDKKVNIYKEDITHHAQNNHTEYKIKLVKTLEFPCPIWRVSWSPMGNILAVAQGDNVVSMWKENLQGEWINVKEELNNSNSNSQNNNNINNVNVNNNHISNNNNAGGMGDGGNIMDSFAVDDDSKLFD